VVDAEVFPKLIDIALVQTKNEELETLTSMIPDYTTHLYPHLHLYLNFKDE
jgi:hypothetical protein